MTNLPVANGRTNGMTPAPMEGLVPTTLALINEQIEIAKIYIKSGLLPKAITRPEEAVIIMQMGQSLKIPYIQALNGLYIVNKRAAMQADLMRALIFRSYPKAIFNVLENTDKICVIEAARPEGKPVKFSFSIEQAKRAGLAGKGVWLQYPEAMLLARVTAIVGRVLFADALNGIIYTPEELGAVVDEDGVPISSENHNLNTESLNKVLTDEEKKARAEFEYNQKRNDVTSSAVDLPSEEPTAKDVALTKPERTSLQKQLDAVTQKQVNGSEHQYAPNDNPRQYSLPQHELIVKLLKSHAVPNGSKIKIEAKLAEGNMEMADAAKAIDYLTAAIEGVKEVETALVTKLELNPIQSRWLINIVKDWNIKTLNAIRKGQFATVVVDKLHELVDEMIKTKEG